MTITELDLSVTTSSANISTLTAQFVPQAASYVQFINPSATNSFYLTLNGTAVAGSGTTVAPLGSSTISCPPGIVYPLASVKIIGSAATNATVLWS